MFFYFYLGRLVFMVLMFKALAVLLLQVIVADTLINDWLVGINLYFVWIVVGLVCRGGYRYQLELSFGGGVVLDFLAGWPLGVMASFLVMVSGLGLELRKQGFMDSLLAVVSLLVGVVVVESVLFWVFSSGGEVEIVSLELVLGRLIGHLVMLGGAIKLRMKN